MSAPGGGAGQPPRAGCGPGVAPDCDLHLACRSPLCDALGGLAWTVPVVWFHDFGLLPLDGGLQLRLGVTPPSGAPARIRALTATIIAPGTGALMTQEFPLSPYVDPEREAAHAIILGERDGRFVFARGAAAAPLVAADWRRLRSMCGAIEAWAGLLSGGGLPAAAVPAALRTDALLDAGPDGQPVVDDQEQLVLEDEGHDVADGPPPGATRLAEPASGALGDAPRFAVGRGRGG